MEFIASTLTCSKEVIIPDNILKSLNRKKTGEYTFAKYGEEYNDTDIPAYPNKRIILSGIRNDSNLGFIFYEKGGIVVTKNLLLYKIVGKKIYVTRYSLDGKYETIELLKENMKREICF